MKVGPRKVLSSGAAMCSETWKYSYATAEYTGLVSLSYIKRGGVIVRPVARVTSPIFKLAGKAYRKTAHGIGRVYDVTASGAGRVYGATAGGAVRAYDATAGGADRLVKAIPMPGRKMRNVEARLQAIEDRLAQIEEHGLVMPGKDVRGEKKALSEDKEMLLKNILLDNLELKDKS